MKAEVIMQYNTSRREQRRREDVYRESAEKAGEAE